MAGGPETGTEFRRATRRRARNRDRVQAGDQEVVPSRDRVKAGDQEVVPNRDRVRACDQEVVPSRHRVQAGEGEGLANPQRQKQSLANPQRQKQSLANPQRQKQSLANPHLWVQKPEREQTVPLSPQDRRWLEFREHPPEKTRRFSGPGSGGSPPSGAPPKALQQAVDLTWDCSAAALWRPGPGDCSAAAAAPWSPGVDCSGESTAPGVLACDCSAAEKNSSSLESWGELLWQQQQLPGVLAWTAPGSSSSSLESSAWTSLQQQQLPGVLAWTALQQAAPWSPGVGCSGSSQQPPLSPGWKVVLGSKQNCLTAAL
ncbi:hypothetical protein CRENBAI_019780 [Crenichthys baileyi]|uniref:Uncharacterized protein n=1 Tax=Crenichthys baileyi TaxID=28760 RepID=A0AAV9SH35_9TELE